MPAFAGTVTKSVSEKSSAVGEGKVLKVDQIGKVESPLKTGSVVTQGGSPIKNGSSTESESQTVASKGLGVLKQLTSNGSSSNDATLSTRTLNLGSWGKFPIVVRKTRKLEENAKSPVPAAEQQQKKMKLSTVPKVVPLINTVGNQSKLIPLTFPSASQASSNTSTAAVNSSVPQPKLVKKDTLKPMSILEATLTSASKDLISNSNNIPKSKAEISLPNSPLVPSLEQQSKHEDSAEKGAMPLLNSAKRPKCVISYEKGITRLVAVERRTVTMVDVSVQVSIPQLDAESQATQLIPNAVSTETGTSQPQTTSTLPLPHVVVLDSNGKKVLAIPKQMLTQYGGAKKFLIEGKGIKRKADNPIENLVKDDLNGAASPTSVTNSVTSSAPTTGKTFSDASLSFKTLTTSSCQTLSSISTSQQSSCISSESAGSLPSVTAPLNRPPTIVLSQTPNGSHIITSDSLVLPINPTVQSEGQSFQQAIRVPSSSTVQTLSNNSDSIILPLNSPLGTRSVNSDTSMGVLPNCYVVMSNSNHATNKEPQIVENQSALTFSPLMNLVEQVKASSRTQRLVNSLSQSVNQKTGQVNSTVVPKLINNTISNISNNINIKNIANIGKAGGIVSGSSAGSRSDGLLDPSSKSDRERIVKAAFIDFKQCLSFNRNGQLPIHSAIESNNVAALKRQCIVLRARKASVDIKNSQDESPLQLAFYFGHTSCIKVLLEYGANCRFFDQDGNSPLHLAVLYAVDALQYLLAPGRFTESFINSLNDEGFSALHLAAQYDQVEAIHLLITFGADIDLPDGKCGRTALFHAVERKKYRSQQILEKYGANNKEPTFTGVTPFSMTRSDAIAQIASGQNTYGEIIDSETLLKPRRSRIGRVK